MRMRGSHAKQHQNINGAVWLRALFAAGACVTLCIVAANSSSCQHDSVLLCMGQNKNKTISSQYNRRIGKSVVM